MAETEPAVRLSVLSNLTGFPDARPAVMVVSHERSGTHFLMNTLATCYEYVSAPRIDLDWIHVNINYYKPSHFSAALLEIAARPVANVVKSHHAEEFFAGELPNITNRYVIFYIYRNPIAVMLSYWRFILQAEGIEGPRSADPVSFAQAEPCGRMMRYQMRQFPNLMARWASHVEGWQAAAKGLPRIVLVRYEDLDSCFETTVRGFANVLERQPQTIARPPRDVNVVFSGSEDRIGPSDPPALEALVAACRQSVGTTMARLGY